MRITSDVIACVLFILAYVALPAPLAAQGAATGRERIGGRHKAKELPKVNFPSPAETLTGQAKVNRHAYKMEKGNTYRISVKAAGFIPQVRIEGQSSGMVGNPVGSTVSNLPTVPAQDFSPRSKSE